MSVYLYAISLLISLNAQHNLSVLSGAWLPFMLGSVVLNLYRHPGVDRYEAPPLILWLIAITASVFILAPVAGGANVGWALAAAPLVGLSIRRENIKGYSIASLAVIFLYACGLLAQVLIHFRYTRIWYDGVLGNMPAWPLLDPNNAACIVTIGLIPSFYMALRRPKWWIITGVLASALIFTESKAACGSAVIACGILAIDRLRISWSFVTLALGIVIIALFPLPIWDTMALSLGTRGEIWQSSARLLDIHPLTGTGLGTFPFYYAQVRTEHITGGWFAHNDLLQLAIEMGAPCVACLILLMISIVARTWSGNLVSGCVLLAVFIESMLEFQLYLPSVSLLLGVALAYHSVNHRPYSACETNVSRCA